MIMDSPMVRIALYQPDIPQNAGATMRLCSCLGLGLDIIEPCGFIMNDKKLRRSGMDYIDNLNLQKHSSWEKFMQKYCGHQRILLLTTKSSVPYTDFTFRSDDILLAGRESAGVSEEVHNQCDERLYIPMPGGGRSLNVVNSLAIVAGEALRQTMKGEDVANTVIRTTQ